MEYDEEKNQIDNQSSFDDTGLETLPISRSDFRRLNIFKNVTFESLAGYLLSCETLIAEPGAVLIDPNHSERRIIIVLSGLLEVRSEASGGSFSNTIEVGQSAGEMSVFDNVRPSASVIAKEQSRILVIPADVAMAMLNASHELCLNFLHIMSNRIRNNSNLVCKEEFHIRCIEENARVDALTGLHNRRWLEEMYTREINRSNAGNFLLASFMLDIDHFKQVNDVYGHLAGDEVLIGVARAITNCLRPSDMPVRYGGEEFTVFLPGTSTENAKMIAERLRKSVEKAEIEINDGRKLHVTVSIGFAQRMHGDTVQTLIARSDKALYHAKENGRNRVCLNSGIDEMILF